MLRTKPWRSASLRLLTDHDRDEVLALCDRDPVANVFVSARIRSAGLDPSRLGGQVWGYSEGGQLTALCYSGANLVPVEATPDAITAFAARARMQGRRCSSIVGPAEAVSQLWSLLAPSWGRPRDVRPVQPVLAMSGPSPIEPDPLVRMVRPRELDVLLPSCIAMFTEEVGVSPDRRGRRCGLPRPDGRPDRRRPVVRADRGWARCSSRPRSAPSRRTPARCRASGCRRTASGRGHAVRGMAAVVHAALELAPVVTLYVNDFNAPARAAYQRVGFTQAGTFMSVLF